MRKAAMGQAGHQGAMAWEVVVCGCGGAATNDFDFGRRYRPVNASTAVHRDPRELLDELAEMEREIQRRWRHCVRLLRSCRSVKKVRLGDTAKFINGAAFQTV